MIKLGGGGGEILSMVELALTPSRGGGGDDTFAYLSVADSRGGQFDTVTDFASGSKIDLTAFRPTAFAGSRFPVTLAQRNQSRCSKYNRMVPRQREQRYHRLRKSDQWTLEWRQFQFAGNPFNRRVIGSQNDFSASKFKSPRRRFRS